MIDSSEASELFASRYYSRLKSYLMVLRIQNIHSVLVDNQ